MKQLKEKVRLLLIKLSPGEQARFLIELMAYSLPKYQPIENSEGKKTEPLNVHQPQPPPL